ncbi:hypothetical protein [Ferrimonas balearica]|uniref:hypothetical protein n=1 Tax=Ferrimonas balearica TaxID=44012 RepID=UPI001C9A27C3|nr:hypothetical protein [Ferrimonas balearica]MBY5994164.1 hypothetical protein [Ferrimonas balearica]
MKITPSVSRLTPLSALVATLALGYTSAVQAVPEASNPVWNDPANTADSCMADAYIETGGKGLKDRVGQVINCTAEDVEIAEVTVTAVDGEGPDSSGNFTCTLGDTIEVTADLRVRTNAAERYDTTFFVSRNLNSPQVVQQDDQACSILVPKNNFMATGNAQMLDADVCGDIAKAGLTDDEYTLVSAVFTMTCTAPAGSDEVEFNYCAAWDVQEDNNCAVTGAAPGQEPSSKAKCNCDILPLGIFIEPDPAGITKTLVGSNTSAEPNGTYEYKVTITRGSTDADLVITDIDDLYRSVADDTTPRVNTSDAPVVFDLDSTNTDTTTPDGKLTLLGADNECYDTLPVTLTAGSPMFMCNFKVRINDEDLPDADDPTDEVMAPPAGIEVYQNFIRISSEDINGDPVGDDTCDVTDNDLTNDMGNCSGVISVNLTNVDPAVSITKAPVAGPGLRDVGGAWFVDNQGLVTYEITITNNSTVDALTLLTLTDTSVANLLNDDSGTPACDTAPISLAANGGNFTCRYIVDVTLAQGANYVNTVAVTGKDNENRRASNTASVTITRATPQIVLAKEVAQSVNVSTPSPALNSSLFMDSVTINEPGGANNPVVYRFTITNANTTTMEDLSVTSLVDDTLFGSLRALKASSQRADECSFPQTVSVGTPYVCTYVAEVEGNATNVAATAYDDTQLVNTAYVNATSTSGAMIQSNTDMATVLFQDVPPSMDSEFGLLGTVFLRVTNTTFEDIYLSNLEVLDTEVVDGANSSTGGFMIQNEGGTLGTTAVLACPEPIAPNNYTGVKTLTPGESFTCAFSVRLSGFTAEDFADFTAAVTSGDAVLIQFVDEEGSPANADAEVQVTSDLP